MILKITIKLKKYITNDLKKMILKYCRELNPKSWTVYK